MKSIYFVIAFLVVPSIVFSQWNYPPTEKADSIETYFGETISDPYQWLENLDNTKVKDWFKTQSVFTKNILLEIPNREILISEMEQLDKVKAIKYWDVAERNGRYFFMKRLPGEEIGQLYYRDGSNGTDVMIFDPLKYEPGKIYTLGQWILSDDGKDVMLDITESGKERPFIKIMNVESKKFYPEEIKAAYSGGFLEGSNKQFFYLKLQGDDVHKFESTHNSKYFMHTLGDPMENDVLLVGREHNPELNIRPEDYPYITYDTQGNFLFAGKGNVDNNHEYFYAPKSQLTSKNIEWKPFCKREDEIVHIYNYGNDVYCLTSKNASNFKIIKVSLPDPDVANAKLIYNGGRFKNRRYQIYEGLYYY